MALSIGEEGDFMFSERLNAVRHQRGITAQQMADALGTGIRNYRKYESGHARPTLEGLIQIADILDVSTDYLLGRDDFLAKHADLLLASPPAHPKGQ